MLILVTGGNGSGKSAYAERLATEKGAERRYIATMIPHGEEGELRVKKHIRQRAGMGFLTQELPYAVGGADVSSDSVVLLEDVSNLLGNAMFGQGGTRSRVLADIRKLEERCGLLIAVTIGGLRADAYDGETRAYIEALNALNDDLYADARAVIALCGGTPAVRKGGGLRLV